MKSNVVPLSHAANVSPAIDGTIIAECLNEAIEQFGPKNLAMAIIEATEVAMRKAA